MTSPKAQNSKFVSQSKAPQIINLPQSPRRIFNGQGLSTPPGLDDNLYEMGRNQQHDYNQTNQNMYG